MHNSATPPAYFVTATGTDIGKTIVTATLLRYLRQLGYHAEAVKPVMSGYQPESGFDSDPASDAAYLLAAMGKPVDAETVAAIAPWRFPEPLSPHRAAELDGSPLSPPEIIGWCQDWLARTGSGPRFIEGVGGVMVPLTYDYTVLDWMVALGLPVLLVTGDYLGTLSHTLTALDVMHRSGLSLAGIIVNQSIDSADHFGSITTLRRLCPYPDTPIATLPRLEGGDNRDAAMALTQQCLSNNAEMQDFILFAQHLC